MYSTQACPQTCLSQATANMQHVHVQQPQILAYFVLNTNCFVLTNFHVCDTHSIFYPSYIFSGIKQMNMYCMAVGWIGSQKRCIAQRQKSSAHIPKQNTSRFVEYFAVYPKIFVAVHHLFFKYREDPKVAQGCGTWCKQDVHRVLYYLVVAINTTCNNALGFQAF